MGGSPQKQEPIRDELGRFPKGVSGNPGGRPKGRVNLHDLMVRELIKEVQGSQTKAKQLAKRLVADMLKDPAKMERFIHKLQDRDEGPVANKVELDATFTMDDLAQMVNDGFQSESPERN